MITSRFSDSKTFTSETLFLSYETRFSDSNRNDFIILSIVTNHFLCSSHVACEKRKYILRHLEKFDLKNIFYVFEILFIYSSLGSITF